MTTGIDHTQRVFVELSGIVISAIEILKNGNNVFKNVGPLMSLANNARGLVIDIPSVLPELRDLDEQEALQLAHSAYDCLKGIMDAIQK